MNGINCIYPLQLLIHITVSHYRCVNSDDYTYESKARTKPAATIPLHKLHATDPAPLVVTVAAAIPVVKPDMLWLVE